MDEHNNSCAVQRLFAAVDVHRLDDLGFLDPAKTPQLLRFDAILRQPLTWIIGPPWLGKSKVAGDAFSWMRLNASAIPGVDGRHALTDFSHPGVERDVPPTWWQTWRQSDPGPAIWLLDGVDEGLDRNSHLFESVLRALEDASVQHRRELRLILFSRPYSELGDFQERLQDLYGWSANSSTLRLAPLDRVAAETLVGPDHFPGVCDLIRNNDLQTVAGYPIVLLFLKKYGKDCRLTVPDVWKGVLTALLGERSVHPRVRFATDPADRFQAACRIAGILTLTRRSTIREYSPDPNEATILSLFATPDNRRYKAAQESLQTAAFVMLPEQGAYQFAQRNVQDWLAAFGFAKLPVHTLRSALIDDDGAIVPGLREGARLVRTMTAQPGTRELIDSLFGGIALPSDAVGPTLGAVCACLDRLEALATNSPWGLRGDFYSNDDLTRLRVAGLDKVLADRLRDKSRSHRAKDLLIEVSEATKSLDALDAATELVLDANEDGALRVRALILVVRLGGDANLCALERAIGENTSGLEIDCRLRGLLLSELLKRRLWPIWRAALWAPKESMQVVDGRTMLLRELGERIALEDVDHLLPHLRDLYSRHLDYESANQLPDFLTRLLELAAESGDQNHVASLVQFALELADSRGDYQMDIAETISRQLQQNSEARRRFYEHDTEVMRSGSNVYRRVGAIWLLLPEDWEWLRDQALGRWPNERPVWEDAYWMARQSNAQGTIRSDEWEAFLRVVEQHAPGLPAQFEHNVLHQQAERERREAERLAYESRCPSRKPLAERLAECFLQQDVSDADRMRDLAWLCFGPRMGIEGQGAGEWDDLHVDLKSLVLDACRRGLETGTPTALPRSTSIAGTVLSEAAAFLQVGVLHARLGWLTGEMIRRWLPTALFVSQEWTDPIRACASVSQTVTEEVVLNAIEIQACAYSEPYAVRQIPSECWTHAMTKKVFRLIGDSNITPRGRRELLLQMADREPIASQHVAQEWASRPIMDGDVDCLRVTGRNVLLRTNPEAVLGMIEAEFDERGEAVLRELGVLWGWRDEFHVDWRAWPSEVLERLCRRLIRGYPLVNDPEERGGFVTADQELRTLRNGIIGELLNRGTPESNAVIDRFVILDTKLEQWVATRRASEAAETVLKQTDVLRDTDKGALSLQEATKLLDRTSWRLIRSEDDLLDAVLEALTQCTRDIGYDLPMLYGAPDRSKTAQPRKRLEEDSLRSYLRRRLIDRLPLIVDGVNVEILQEDQVAYRQKFDLRVLVPSHTDRRSIQVVLEVKWSDNESARTSLIDQLGDRYLRGEGLSHGIFVVGWCGHWRPRDGTGNCTDMDSLQTHLKVQRDDYCKAGHPGQGLRIEPFILDLSWSIR